MFLVQHFGKGMHCLQKRHVFIAFNLGAYFPANICKHTFIVLGYILKWIYHHYAISLSIAGNTILLEVVG